MWNWKIPMARVSMEEIAVSRERDPRQQQRVG